jgi:hypothetical protein
MLNKPTVFIHTNEQQIIGAYVAMYSMQKASAHADKFDVRLVRLEETPHLMKRQGKQYRRKGKDAVWLNEDLQSFSPLRRMIPQLMGFEGRAVVTDPDVFAIGDIYDLLTMDMGGKAIMCRNINEGYKGNGKSFYASSVMLLDCSKLKHWHWDNDIDQMFKGKLDYGPWIGLSTEDPESIGELGEEWNSFDKLTPKTRLLHTTERLTQPWKTGLPIDFDLTTAKAKPNISRSSLYRLWRKLTSDVKDALHPPRYRPHPDPAQEQLFFKLLKGAIEEGYVSRDALQKSISSRDVRPDVVKILKKLGATI